MNATIREYEGADLGRLLDLWERLDAPLPGEPKIDEAVDLIGSEDVTTLVAEREGELIGVAIASASGPIGWIHRLNCLPGIGGHSELVDDLLGGLEQRLVAKGVRKIAAVAPAEEQAMAHLQGWDYRPAEGAVYMERQVPATAAVPTGLAEVWGRTINPGLWEELKGLEQAKEIIERRVILPLQEPELAARHAVSPPKAIVLFGPPGTGKTTFAKGISSRLGWPFVEIQPRELAGEGPEHEARLLAETLDRILDLSSAVVFVDEVEDLASIRHEDRRVSASVTNEFLKQIPRLREAPSHLLICATNWVDRLDPAFLRPGRFDYVLPVGPPDPQARGLIWARYVGEITDKNIDIKSLVEASEFFTPADIEFTARKAAQAAFERDHFDKAGYRATTDDFLTAIQLTRPTLSRELVDGFAEETKRFARY
jgi:transitional endoplasmic reticulum ATPase